LNCVTNIACEPDGGPSRRTYGNGLVRANTYDLDGRLTGISTTVPSSSALIQSLAYGFDANDTITAISNGANASLTQSFGYDELTRLTGVTSNSGNWTWGYDGNGNRSSQTSSYGSAAYSVAAASNQYLAVSGANGRSFGFDALGNRISDTGAGGTLSLHYDAFNRMDRSTWAGVTTSYHVNPLGQRTTKSTPGGNWTRFVYAADGSLLTERGPAGMTDYLWLGGTLVGMVRNNVLYAIHTDHLGRPERVTSPTQAIVWRANNYAFHRDVAQDNIGGLNLGFPGQYFDAETGLWNNGFRDYDSSMGAYVESDPIGLAGGSIRMPMSEGIRSAVLIASVLCATGSGAGTLRRNKRMQRPVITTRITTMHALEAIPMLAAQDKWHRILDGRQISPIACSKIL